MICKNALVPSISALLNQPADVLKKLPSSTVPSISTAKKQNLVRKSKNFLLGRMYLFGCLLLIFELIIFFAFSFQND